MRILVASHLLPSPRAPHAGGQVIFHVLRELAGHGHTVDLVAKMLPHEQAYLADLRDICSQVIVVESGATRRALLANILRSGVQQPGAMLRWRGRRNNMLVAQQVERLLRDHAYDLVQLELAQMLPLARVVGNRAPVLLMLQDLESKLAYRRMQQAPWQQRFWRGWLWHATLRTELRGLQACSAVAPYGAFDLRMLRALLPNKPLLPAPIWLPIGQPLPPPPAGPLRLLFVGALWRPINEQAVCWLLDAIWPRVHARLPDAQVLIVGHGASQGLQTFANGRPGVHLVGSVPELRSWYAQCQVVIAPVQASGGILLKVLDALALGRPVVTTPAGNEGVGAQPGRDLLVADTPEALADTVVTVYRSPSLATRLVEHGRSYVLDRFGWQKSFERYEQYISRLARRT